MIEMNFEIPFPPFYPPRDNNSDCFASRGDIMIQDLIDSVNVLNGALIDTGSFVVEVDRKKITGGFVIQTDDISELGQIRIKYGMGAGFAPDKVEETPNIDGSITFEFTGTIIVWQTDLNVADQKIVACPDQTVFVTLTRSAGQQ